MKTLEFDPQLIGIRQQLIALLGVAMLPVFVVAWDGMRGEFGIALASLLLGSLFAWQGARQLTSPIARLREEASALARGGFARRVPVEGPSEIRALAQDFNNMAMLIEEGRRRLEISERRFRELTELSSDWYWESDAEHRFSFVSVGAERFFGSAADQLVGRARWELDYLSMSREAWEQHRAGLDRGKAFEDFRLSRRAPSGMVFHFAISGRPVYDASGEFLGYRGVGHDITAEVEAQSALRTEHDRLSRVFDTMAEGVVLFDADGRYVRMNTVAERILGNSRRQLQGRTLREIPVRREPFGTGVDLSHGCIFESLREGQLQDTGSMFYLVRPDRSRVLVSRNAARLEDDAGHFEGVIATFEDVTDRMRSEERNRLFLATAHDGFWVVDRTGRIQEVNRAMCDLLGTAEAQLLGKRVSEVVHGMDDSTMGWRIGHVVKAGHARFDTEHRRPDGGVVTLEVTATYVDVDGGRIYAFFQDVSERKRLEALVREANASLEHTVRERTAELEEANRDLESYNYSISHDLRQPLGALTGYAELLREHPARATEWAGEIEANATRMEKLINSLLALASAGRRAISKVEVDMRALAESVVHELRADTPPGTATVFGELPPAPGDPVLLRQVWTNLIGNALKYSSQSRAPCVQISGAHGDAQVEYTVSDNGVGFDMQAAGRMFEPFQRLHSARQFEGSGVGLAIVERIVRRHGGVVGVQSAPGLGATFRFTLPT